MALTLEGIIKTVKKWAGEDEKKNTAAALIIVTVIYIFKHKDELDPAQWPTNFGKDVYVENLKDILLGLEVDFECSFEGYVETLENNYNLPDTFKEAYNYYKGLNAVTPVAAEPLAGAAVPQPPPTEQQNDTTETNEQPTDDNNEQENGADDNNDQQNDDEETNEQQNAAGETNEQPADETNEQDQPADDNNEQQNDDDETNEQDQPAGDNNDQEDDATNTADSDGTNSTYENEMKAAVTKIIDDNFKKLGTDNNTDAPPKAAAAPTPAAAPESKPADPPTSAAPKPASTSAATPAPTSAATPAPTSAAAKPADPPEPKPPEPKPAPKPAAKPAAPKAAPTSASSKPASKPAPKPKSTPDTTPDATPDTGLPKPPPPPPTEKIEHKDYRAIGGKVYMFNPHGVQTHRVVALADEKDGSGAYKLMTPIQLDKVTDDEITNNRSTTVGKPEAGKKYLLINIEKLSSADPKSDSSKPKIEHKKYRWTGGSRALMYDGNKSTGKAVALAQTDTNGEHILMDSETYQRLTDEEIDAGIKSYDYLLIDDPCALIKSKTPAGDKPATGIIKDTKTTATLTDRFTAFTKNAKEGIDAFGAKVKNVLTPKKDDDVPPPKPENPADTGSKADDDDPNVIQVPYDDPKAGKLKDLDDLVNDQKPESVAAYREVPKKIRQLLNIPDGAYAVPSKVPKPKPTNMNDVVKNLANVCISNDADIECEKDQSAMLKMKELMLISYKKIWRDLNKAFPQLKLNENTIPHLLGISQPQTEYLIYAKKDEEPKVFTA